MERRERASVIETWDKLYSVTSQRGPGFCAASHTWVLIEILQRDRANSALVVAVARADSYAHVLVLEKLAYTPRDVRAVARTAVVNPATAAVPVSWTHDIWQWSREMVAIRTSSRRRSHMRPDEPEPETSRLPSTSPQTASDHLLAWRPVDRREDETFQNRAVVALPQPRAVGRRVRRAREKRKPAELEPGGWLFCDEVRAPGDRISGLCAAAFPQGGGAEKGSIVPDPLSDPAARPERMVEIHGQDTRSEFLQTPQPDEYFLPSLFTGSLLAGISRPKWLGTPHDRGWHREERVARVVANMKLEMSSTEPQHSDEGGGNCPESERSDANMSTRCPGHVELGGSALGRAHARAGADARRDADTVPALLSQPGLLHGSADEKNNNNNNNNNNTEPQRNDMNGNPKSRPKQDFPSAYPEITNATRAPIRPLRSGMVGPRHLSPQYGTNRQLRGAAAAADSCRGTVRDGYLAPVATLVGSQGRCMRAC
ncbi:unnamed protein product [Diplocarpon coronariae]|nr:hypothetical protein JHW43_003730 [Diplocarpon mali]